MMQSRRVFFVAVLTIAVAGCRTDGAAPISDDAAGSVSVGDVASPHVTVVRVSGGVRITNGTQHPVAYVVWNHDYHALMAPCVDPSSACVRLAAGAAVTVPDAQIEGAAAGMKDAVVRWWHVVPDGHGGHRVDKIHVVVVHL